MSEQELKWTECEGVCVYQGQRIHKKWGGGAQINAAFISTESLMHTCMCGRSVVGVVS